MSGRYPGTVGPEVIRKHVLGLAGVARSVPLDTPVPSCPEWSLADLVWHVTEGGLFWTRAIAGRPDEPEAVEESSRPPDADLIDALERAGAALADALVGVDRNEPAWSWSDDQTVGFTVRRQSHEAVVHHVDARLAAGIGPPEISSELAADGVDEMVHVMLAGVPDWARFERGSGVLTLRTSDTGDEWTSAFGRMTGTSPDSGTEYVLDALEPVDEPADVVVEGEAVGIHLWLAGRADLTGLSVRGDRALADRLRSIAASL